MLRQGPDVGTQYRSALCVHTPEQQEAARKVLELMQQKWKGEIKTQIICDKCVFWPAEEYHQLYLQKHPGGYCTHKKHF
ncbi:hypothetical protein Efla_003928 [Eimeria flavescens]